MEVCPLPYPGRYEAAAAYVTERGAATLPDEARLVLYALRQQSAHGPVGTARAAGVPEAAAPSIFSVVERAKYNAWLSLGEKMPPMEAMRLFVRALEEEVPDWWALHTAPANGAAANGRPADGGRAAADEGAAGPSVQWEALEPSRASGAGPDAPCSPAPPPRYEHSMVAFGPSVVAFAGNNGRFLGDTHVFSLEERTWERVELEVREYIEMALESGAEEDVDAFDDLLRGDGEGGARPPCLPSAGQAACVYGDYIIAVGGHFNATDLSHAAEGAAAGQPRAEQPPGEPILVRVIDLRRRIVMNVPTTAAPDAGAPGGGEEADAVPINRGGHSCCIIGDTLFMFGGETNRNRRLLNDCHALDLPTMQWSRVRPAGDVPSPRTCHTAAAAYGRYMLVFGGGGSLSQVFSDCYVLDAVSRRWTAVALRGEGHSKGTPAPRAGHGSSLVGSEWYIAGGGNNYGGLLDTICIDLRGLRPAAGPGRGGAAGASLSGSDEEEYDEEEYDEEDGLPVDSLPWRGVAQVSSTSPVASEGLCIVTVDAGDAGGADGDRRPLLLAFGGYNGKYNNAMSVLRPRPRAGGADAADACAAPAGGRRILDLPLPEELRQQQERRELRQIKRFEDENAQRRRSQQATAKGRGGFGFGARDGRVDRKIVVVLQNKLKDMAGKVKVLESQLNLANARLMEMDRLEKENARLRRQLGPEAAPRRTASGSSHGTVGDLGDGDDEDEEDESGGSSSEEDGADGRGAEPAANSRSNSRFWFLS